MGSYVDSASSAMSEDILWRVAKNFLIFALLSSLVLCSLIVWEIFFGKSADHPIWNRNYNWFPIVSVVTAVSALGSVAYTSSRRLAQSAHRFAKKFINYCLNSGSGGISIQGG